MFRNNKILRGNALIVLLAVLSPLVVSPFVMAEPETDEKSVTATVTVTTVSISIASGTITYGTLSTGSTVNTVTLSQTQTITNNSNVNVDIKVKGQDSANWTLAGTAGSNAYTHATCVANCGEASPTWTNLTTGYVTEPILSPVAPSATPTVDFRLQTPTSTTFFTQQTVSVSVMGIES